MMDWSDRLLWLAIGGAIGYFVRTLQDIKREVHEVDEIVTRRERDESGFARFPLILDAALIILFSLTIWSAFRVEISVDRANEAVAELQREEARDALQDERIATISACTLESQSKTIRALNERTSYTSEQLKSNVAVLATQLRFLEIVLVIPPVSEQIQRESLEAYVQHVDEFIRVADRTERKTDRFDYPTNQELSECLRENLTDPIKENP